MAQNVTKRAQHDVVRMGHVMQEATVYVDVLLNSLVRRVARIAQQTVAGMAHVTVALDIVLRVVIQDGVEKSAMAVRESD